MCAQRQKRSYTDIADLYSKFEPTLRAGPYQMEFTQQVFDPSGALLDDLTANGQKNFTVSGPQFSLQPADLGNSYPPPGHSGLFEFVLPYIQLNNSHLPWIRKLDTSIPKSDDLPWLSLLMLQENEWQGDGTPSTASIEEFLTSSQDIAVPNIDLQQIEDITQSCKYIEMSVGTFQTHFPKPDDLRWVASARLLQSATQGKAIITARRFPIISDPQIHQQRYACYLVSLEGLEDFLMPTTRPESKIRLACLHYWTFTTINQTGESFRDLLKNMLKNAIAQPDDIWLRLPRSLIEQIPEADRERLLDGYVPLNYHTRSGEETLSWYRGPFIPVSETMEKPASKPHYTSNELLIYDPDEGVLDTTWSVSSEIGKALALQDSSFIKELLQARKWWVRSLDKASAFEGSSIDQQLNQRILNWSKLLDRALSFNADTVVPTQQRTAWRRERLLSRPDPIARLRRAANDGELIQSIQQGKSSLYDNGTTWCGNRVKFSDMPIMYLIPNEHMLPMEAFRLFHVDPTWIEAMFDGIFSIGIQTDLDEIINRHIRWDYTANIDIPVFGIILRSALISGWPDVHVEGWRQGRRLNLLSDDRRDNILFCLFDEVPDMITITEDQDDLTYGMNTDYTIGLRNVTSSEFGKIIPNGETSIQGFISPSGLIDITAMQLHLQSRISDLTGINIELNPVTFMLQLINGADRGVITIS